jgi:hypothetical protein
MASLAPLAGCLPLWLFCQGTPPLVLVGFDPFNELLDTRLSERAASQPLKVWPGNR